MALPPFSPPQQLHGLSASQRTGGPYPVCFPDILTPSYPTLLHPRKEGKIKSSTPYFKERMLSQRMEWPFGVLIVILPIETDLTRS